MTDPLHAKYDFKVKLLFLVIMIIILTGLLEGGARLVFLYKTGVKGILGSAGISLNMDVYEEEDPNKPGNWRLRRSTDWTLQDLIHDKEARGAVLGAAHLKETAELYQISDDEVAFKVNKHGFKGPEIDMGHSKKRILTIGDSCTFGSWVDRFSYPRSMERKLNVMGHSVEVVNAGVEAYSPKNVLYRIEEFKSLKPDIVTVYIGWNAIYVDPAAERGVSTLAIVRLLNIAWERISMLDETEQERALRMYERRKNPDRDAQEVVELDSYTPSFIDDVESIIKEMLAEDSRVALITLPGLFTLDEPPSEAALKIGHLPAFTNNPYVLAKMAARYNDLLEIMAQKYDLPLIDLDLWSRVALQPRADFFTDSVHLTEQGQMMLGEQLAKEMSAISSVWQ